MSEIIYGSPPLEFYPLRGYPVKQKDDSQSSQSYPAAYIELLLSIALLGYKIRII